ncbi:YggT family protein [Amycolatopsis sp. H20-H5]|uniref:YggT family protein n=1 Tax=Amycolatopsis sp. H20-H5 TaxID=3046309 RepID=UPI002DB8112A|nr:YggT family protein [Amycolatopsis sp. H20-H5]MEC3981947.1 YggT family protein [Amycolatopsis sp. H20-H5]
MSAVIALVSLVLLLFQLVLIARLVFDWVGVLSPGGAEWVLRGRGFTHAVTEPVLAPVRRVLRPVRLGSMSIDLAFTVVFVLVVFLRAIL